METKPITDKDYADNPRCPRCGSYQYYRTENEEDISNKAGNHIGEKVQFLCDECDAIWTEVTKVVGYEDLHVDEDEK
jgi:phage terminase large subunit GpA-like protein